MPVEVPHHLDNGQNLTILPLAEIAIRARHLPVEDKADILDLFLDLSLHAHDLVNQPDRLADTLKLILEIVCGHAEDTSSTDVPPQDESDEEPVEFQRWKDFVAGRVRSLRQERGWTQTELAGRSGLRQSHISRIERASHSPSRKTVERLASAFGIGVGELDPSE